MGAAVIPYAFAGRIGIDFGTFFDFGTLDFWDSGGFGLAFVLVPFAPGVSGIGGFASAGSGDSTSSWILYCGDCLLPVWINLGFTLLIVICFELRVVFTVLLHCCGVLGR